MSEPDKIYLFDAYALIYRAFYAFIRNPLYSSKGLNTSAILGFTNSLLEIWDKENPSHIAVAFDPQTPTFRHEMFPEYKANRQKMPEDIQKAIPYIKAIIDAFKIPVIQSDGYEADDIIGTLASHAEKDGYITYMVTPDKDYTQLVDEKTFMYKPKKTGNELEIWGIPEVCNKYAVDEPKQVIDILALWGDSSDNIPGAPGIGEVTAKKLIGKYKSVEGIYEHIDELKGKQKENLIQYKDQVILSKKLVTIALNAPMEWNWEALKAGEPDFAELKKLFEELEFKTLIKRFFGESVDPKVPRQGSLFPDDQPSEQQNVSHETIPSAFQTATGVTHEYKLADTYEKRQDLLQKLKQVKAFCFDTETTSLDIQSTEIVGIAFSYKPHTAWFVLLPEDRELAWQTMQEFKPVFEDDRIGKVGQNLKFDIRIVNHYGIEVKGELFDTMIAHYLIQPELRHNLTYLCEQYLNYKPISIETLIGKKGKGQLTMRNVALDELTEYAGEDADVTWQIKEIIQPRLKENKLEMLFTEMEMPLLRVLLRMEENGFRIDNKALEQYGKELSKELEHVEESIIELAGTNFNVASPKQLGEVLFEKMNIDANAKKTKTGQYSTSEDYLLKIQDKHEIIPLILEFRSIKKLLNTYVEALPKLIHEQTGKIHTSFNQTVTATGRLSSTNPNLQNIPIREERGRLLRKAFIPGNAGNVLLAADYSQIELRLMAHMSGDEKMIEAFLNNEDIHTSTAAKIHGISNEQVTKEMRSQAKTANFGIIYGISAFGLAQRLNISRTDAKTLIDGYFNSFPKVKEYMDQSISIAREQGYVSTIMGRKRFLRDINSRNHTVRGMAERNAINAPLQGSAADIIKKAMITIQQRLDEMGSKAKMILQVHDELIFDVPGEELAAIKGMVVQEMENTIELSVPLTVEAGSGQNWLEAH